MEELTEEMKKYYSKRDDLVAGICYLLDGCSLEIAEGILKDANHRLKRHAIDMDKPDLLGKSWHIYDKKQ